MDLKYFKKNRITDIIFFTIAIFLFYYIIDDYTPKSDFEYKLIASVVLSFSIFIAIRKSYDYIYYRLVGKGKIEGNSIVYSDPFLGVMRGKEKLADIYTRIICSSIYIISLLISYYFYYNFSSYFVKGELLQLAISLLVAILSGVIFLRAVGGKIERRASVLSEERYKEYQAKKREEWQRKQEADRQRRHEEAVKNKAEEARKKAEEEKRREEKRREEEARVKAEEEKRRRQEEYRRSQEQNRSNRGKEEESKKSDYSRNRSEYSAYIKSLLTEFELDPNSNITLKDIKSQYIYWVEILHPDKNQNKSEKSRKKAEDKLKRINQIYQILSNEFKNK